MDIDSSAIDSNKKTKHTICDDTAESKTKHGCVCTCCHKKNIIRKNCVIFVKKNYDFKNDVIVHALENRYRERNNKEFICKPCHNKLKEGKLQPTASDNQMSSSQQSHPPVSDVIQFPSNRYLQNPKVTNKCLCVCCRKDDIIRYQCVLFKESRYDLQNLTVKQALKERIFLPLGQEYICNNCDKSLKCGTLPINAVTFTALKDLKCIFCRSIPTDRFCIFDKREYENNATAQIIVENPTDNNIVCNKCHETIMSESILNCVVCKNETPRKLTFTFDVKKYTSMPQNVDTNRTHMRSYICKTCHFQLKPKFSCVCCNRNIEQHLCKQYNIEDYDFSHYIVSRCLPDTSDEGDDKYICISCHKRLVEANPENVSVPYFVNNRCVNAGAKFLKALQEKPQYVCTCCHRLLFQKTVVPFHLQEYDMTNDTVKQSLSYRYRMKLHKNQTSQEHCQYMQHEWPQISQNYPHDDNDVTYMEEFICIRCRQNLKQKNPKMPDQACANGLKLDDIPQDLQQLLTLER